MKGKTALGVKPSVGKFLFYTGKMPPKDISSLKRQVGVAITWWKTSRLGRAFRQYNLANGAVLSGGITYKALFSLFAGLTIGFTVFARVLGNDESLKNSVVDAVNSAIPGLISTSTSKGILSMDSLVLGSTINTTSVIAVVVLLWSVITCMEAVRSSVRVMFALPPQSSNAVKARLRGLLVFACVGLGIILSSALGIAASALGRIIDKNVDIGNIGAGGLQALSFAMSIAFDAVLFVVVVRLLAGIKTTKLDLLYGGLMAAGGFAIIRALGTTAVSGSVKNNPLFATGAVLVTILVWLYFYSRILLTAVAFTANSSSALLDHLEDEQFALARKRAHASDDMPEVQWTIPDDHSTFVDLSQATQRKRGRLLATVFVSALIGHFVGRRSAR